MIFKRKGLLRTGIGIGVQLTSIFLLEIVIVIVKTIVESIHNPTSIDELDQERAKTWKAYKRKCYRE